MDKKILRLQKVREKAIEKLLYEFHYDKYLKDPELLKNTTGIESIDREFVKYLEDRCSTRYQGCMYTINPKENIDVGKFVTICKKIANYKCFKSALWCFEWRDGENGLHCHMIVEYKKGEDPWQATRRVRRGCKNIIGCTKHINPRYSNNLKNFEKYIHGWKNGERKSCWENSEIQRDRNRINSWYRVDK